jgi:hypothetical protein
MRIVRELFRETSRWTTCFECGKKDSRTLVHLGDPEDCESQYVYVCQECLEKALELVKSERPRPEV